MKLETSLEKQLTSLASTGGFDSPENLLKYALNLVELEQKFVDANRDQIEQEIEKAYDEPSFEVNDSFWNGMIERAERPSAD